MKKMTALILKTAIPGAVLGIAYQIFKWDVGGDDLINLRLPLLAMAGIFLFYLVHHFDARLCSTILGRYDQKIDLENLKTYLPLVLLLLYPIQKKLISPYWPRPLFPQVSMVSAGLIILAKIDLLRKMRRGGDSQECAVPGSPATLIVSGTLLLFLFWFHQATFVFDEYYSFAGAHNHPAEYLFHGNTTREAFVGGAEIARTVPAAPIRLIIASKVLDFSEYLQRFSKIPFLFQLRILDEEGGALYAGDHVQNVLAPEAKEWREVRVLLPPRPRDSLIQFRMKIRPVLYRCDWRFLLKILFHNPFDFPFYRSLSIKGAWSEPLIIRDDENSPHIFLISIDTLRADWLTCYRDDRIPTPAIDSLAREGILYRNAFSQSTWTLPSHLSLLTSRFPGELHESTDMQRVWVRSMLGITDIMENPNKTLAEALRESGYHCVAFTDGGFVSAYYGFAKGFHYYSEKHRNTHDSFEAAQEWLADNKGGKQFVFIHTHLVHDYSKGPLPLEDDRRGPERMGLYDNRVAVIDSKMEKFIEFLKAQDIYEQSIIVFTSDHGESFGEYHNEGAVSVFSHGRPPYESQIWVPLIIKPPAGTSAVAPAVVSRDVRLLDVIPTILSILNIDAPAGFRGYPMPPFREEPLEPQYDFVYASSYTPEKGCIRKGGFKYIFDERTKNEEFYDLEKDPKEFSNLVRQRSPQMLQMKEEYMDFYNKIGRFGTKLEQSTQAAPPGLKEQLKALGYLN